jgi:hypothetical protein
VLFPSIMTKSSNVTLALRELGLALRRPESLAERWRDRRLLPEHAPVRAIFPVLLAAAVIGLAAYGLTMGLHKGAPAMLAGAFKAPFAAGAAWTVTVPAFYILRSAWGSKLDFSTTVLAALITCSFGALAMLAGVPVTWFFTLAVPFEVVRIGIHLIVFAGVGVAMADVFLRTMNALEPDTGRGVSWLWLTLIGVIGGELMLLLDLFSA